MKFVKRTFSIVYILIFFILISSENGLTDSIQKSTMDVRLTARRLNEEEWQSNNLVLTPGEEFELKITYRNIGEVSQDQVTLTNELPDYFKYSKKPFLRASANTNGKYAAENIDSFKSNGFNIGGYAPNGNAFVIFQAQAPPSQNLNKGINPYFFNYIIVNDDINTGKYQFNIIVDNTKKHFSLIDTKIWSFLNENIVTAIIGSVITVLLPLFFFKRKSK